MEGRPQFSFFGVFDGHGGKLVAENSAKLTGLLAKIKAAPSWPLAEKDTEALKAAMIHGFIEQDRELREVRREARARGWGCREGARLPTPAPLPTPLNRAPPPPFPRALPPHAPPPAPPRRRPAGPVHAQQ